MHRALSLVTMSESSSSLCAVWHRCHLGIPAVVNIALPRFRRVVFHPHLTTLKVAAVSSAASASDCHPTEPSSTARDQHRAAGKCGEVYIGIPVSTNPNRDIPSQCPSCHTVADFHTFYFFKCFAPLHLLHQERWWQVALLPTRIFTM